MSNDHQSRRSFHEALPGAAQSIHPDWRLRLMWILGVKGIASEAQGNI
jgi:hypothetical protein